MKQLVLAAAWLTVTAAPLCAAAAPLTTAPIELSGGDRCLQCTAANVGRREVTVQFIAAKGNGAAEDHGTSTLSPGEATYRTIACGEVGNFACRFEVLSGGRKNVRAASCDFQSLVGCRAASAAQ